LKILHQLAVFYLIGAEAANFDAFFPSETEKSTGFASLYSTHLQAR